MYFIGAFIAFFGVLVASYFKHLPWSIFINPAAISVNFLAIVGVIVATSGFKTFIMGCNAVTSKSYSISDEDRLRAAELFHLLTKTTIFASVAGVFVGLIAALTYGFDDIVGFTQVMSAAFMPIIGSLMLSVMFFEPAVFILKRPRYNASIISEYPKHLGDRLLELCTQNGLTAGDILDATRIVLKKEQIGEGCMQIGEVGLLTNDVVRLADFYKWLLGVENGSNDTAHQFILTEGTTLTIGHTGLVQNNSNPSMCLAFTVNDVDKEYLRLKEKGVCILEEPKTRMWGVRNMSFRDPDGNLLYFRSFLVDPY